MNFGPHQARAPVTKATQVNPAVDSMNDGFLAISKKKKQYDKKMCFDMSYKMKKLMFWVQTN